MRTGTSSSFQIKTRSTACFCILHCYCIPRRREYLLDSHLLTLLKMLARSTRAAITASKEAGLQNCRGSSFFRSTTTRNANLNHAVSARQLSTTVPGWATLDPNALGVVSTPHYVGNIVGGTWQPEGIIKNTLTIPNPMDRDASALFTVADTSMDELAPFVKSMEAVSKSGVHNPLRNVERYLMYGDISRKVRTWRTNIVLLLCHAVCIRLFHLCSPHQNINYIFAFILYR